MKAVLVVEDDKLLGKAITVALEKAGHSVFWAQNAKEAHDVMSMQELGLVFLDIMLPGDEDGYEILRQMKQNEKLAAIPVVVLSNLGQTSEIDRAMQLGAKDYLVKANIDLAKLVEFTKSNLQ